MRRAFLSALWSLRRNAFFWRRRPDCDLAIPAVGGKAVAIGAEDHPRDEPIAAGRGLPETAQLQQLVAQERVVQPDVVIEARDSQAAAVRAVR